MGIVVLILSLGMIIGGLAPNVGNGIAAGELDKALNHPQKIQVTVYPEAPSYSLLGMALAGLEVDIRQFEIEGLGVEQLYLRADKVALSKNGSQFKLNQPTRAVAKVSLTEAALNKYLSSNQFKEALDNIKKSQNLAASLDADLTELAIELKPDVVNISGKAKTMGGFFTVPFELSGTFRLQTEQQLFIYEAAGSTGDTPVAGDLIKSIISQLNPLVDLAKFSNDDMKLYFRELRVQNDQIDLVAEVELKQIPAAK